MQIVRGLIISASIILVAWATWEFSAWSSEFRDMFFYLEDWSSLIFLMALVLAIGAVFRWLLIMEVKTSRVPKHGRR